ncbi:MAG: ABC transporter permease [Acidimicrobiia bacterium]|nr:ABC transporter permease [Acidimicrobiia bacterium]
MSTMAVLGHVALRELKERARTRAYQLTTAITLLIVIGLIVVPPLIEGGTDEMSVGSIGESNDSIIATAELLANATDEPGQDPSLSIEVVPYTSRELGTEGLREGIVDALLVDGTEIVVETAALGGSSLVGLLQRAAATVELERIVVEQGDVAADVIALMTSDPLETSTLSGDEAGDESRTLIAYAGLMLLYIAVLLYGTWILTGVTEEKSNRVVEVLLASLRPWQLLGGKILGIGLLGMAQLLGTIAAAVIAIQITETFELPTLDLSTVLNLLAWFVLGFLLFAVMFGAAGSLVSRMEDAQNVAFPMSLVAVAGFFVSTVALNDPTGPAAVVGTFVPLTAPFVVPVRAALGAIPAWQYAAAVVLTAAAIVGLTFVAGRIYAGGLLRFGSKVSVREAWRGATQ